MTTKRKLVRIFLALPFAALLSGCGQTFEDCILENMEKAQTREAASIIRKACLDKFAHGNQFDPAAVDTAPANDGGVWGGTQ